MSRLALMALTMMIALVSGQHPAAGADETEGRYMVDQLSAPPRGLEACVAATVEGAEARLCAERDGFGAEWSVELTDTADDGLPVKAGVTLSVVDAPDESVNVGSDRDRSTVVANGRFTPRIGVGLEAIILEVCVVIRLFPDRCGERSVELPQLEALATEAQRARLEELVFEMPLEQFIDVRSAGQRDAVDATFDWSSDGCSAGPARTLFDEDLRPACIRHDFAYRNFGQLGLDATDEVRGRVDDQLVADISALGREQLGLGFGETLQRFGGPVFHDGDLAALWGVPDFIAERLEGDDVPEG